MSWKTEDRQDNGNKCDWRQVWVSCKPPAVTLKIIQTSNSWLLPAEQLRVYVCISVWGIMWGGWGWDRLNGAVLRPPVAAPAHFPPSLRLFAVLFSPPPFHFFATKTSIKLASRPFFFFISYYSPATRLIRPLNWASGRQSLSLRRHQAKQHPAAAVTGSRRRLER